MAAAMPIAFATWSALLNNFVIEVASFTGREIGWLQSVREIPGFLAIGVIVLAVREVAVRRGWSLPRTPADLGRRLRVGGEHPG